MLSTKELTGNLARKFLDPSYAEASLIQVADFAIQESSLFHVQDHIAQIFSAYRPTPAHLIIPTFRWRAIVTTNYDTLIEEAYRQAKEPAQKLVPIYKNVDRWDAILSDDDKVPLLKLHGCITDTHDEGCPLILSTDQYVDYTRGRDRLFAYFEELAAESTIAYVGYSLSDQDIRKILQSLDRQKVGRPRSFMISPSVDAYGVRYWSQRQITAIEGKFDEVMQVFDESVGKHFRAYRRSTPQGVLTITERFIDASAKISEALQKSLEFDLDYVHAALSDANCDARRFYSGVSHTWGPIIRELDVRRKLTDTIIGEYLLEDEPTEHRFILIKASAGSGKSVFLRRLAWEAAISYGRLCLYSRDGGEINSAVIAELMKLCKEHVYVFVDDVSHHRREIESLLLNLGSLVNNLTLIGACRTNEWNNTAASFKAKASNEHPLPYLTERELDELIDRLEAHRCLDQLERMSRNDRRSALKEIAGRQLLVALHEATSGLKFEEILHDEFSRITPRRASEIYLAICLLNQYGIPVRAGLIYRRFGITFEDFRRDFFSPLEDVVITNDYRGHEDYSYSARHPHVAEIVVRNELGNQANLLTEYLQAFNNFNLSFSSDNRAFQKMTQGNLLKRLFSSSAMVYRIFERAEEISKDDPYLMQQQALYEMNRESGDLQSASRLLDRAVELRPKSNSIKHSCSELCLRKAEVARTGLEWGRLISEAERHCRDLKRDAKDSYAYGTLVKAGLMRLSRMDNSNDEKWNQEEWDALVKGIERDLKEGLQRFPNDSHLLLQDANLGKALSASDRVYEALRKSFSSNQRNVGVAIRLARLVEKRGMIPEAQEVYIKALEANRGIPSLHQAYGEFLLNHSLGSDIDLAYHLRHAYTVGDNNYKAQLLHARQLFIMGRFDDAGDLFKSLRKARLPFEIKKERIFPIDKDFTGTIDQVEAFFCNVRCDGAGGTVRLEYEDLSEDIERRDLARYMKITFKIAFTMNGPRAFACRL